MGNLIAKLGGGVEKDPWNEVGDWVGNYIGGLTSFDEAEFCLFLYLCCSLNLIFKDFLFQI